MRRRGEGVPVPISSGPPLSSFPVEHAPCVQKMLFLPAWVLSLSSSLLPLMSSSSASQTWKVRRVFSIGGSSHVWRVGKGSAQAAPSLPAPCLQDVLVGKSVPKVWGKFSMFFSQIFMPRAKKSWKVLHVMQARRGAQPPARSIEVQAGMAGRQIFTSASPDMPHLEPASSSRK